MKKLWPIFLTLLVLSCKEQKEGEKIVTETDPTIFNGVYMDFREMDALEGYEKVTDTSIFIEGNYDPAFRLTELKNKQHTLVLFSKSTVNEELKEIKKVIDTLIIKGIPKDNFITIGYCSLGGKYDQEIVAIVQPTNQSKIEKVVKAWKANLKTEDFEEIYNLDSIICWNEHYLGSI